MTTQHVLKYDGYQTQEERILEGVMFEVQVTETDEGDLLVTGVKNPESDAMYLSKFSHEFFEEVHREIRTRIEENIAHLRSVGLNSTPPKTLTDLLNEFEDEVVENGESLDRIDLLVEV